MPKRTLLLATQAVAGLQALTLGILTVTGTVELWMVFLVAAMFGAVTAFDNPTRQSFVLELVGRKELTNAITLNSVTMNAARIVGPGAAGVVIATVGIGPCFLINAASYLAVIGVVALMRTSEMELLPRVPRMPGQLREGMHYVLGVPELRITLVMMAVIGTLAYEFQVILPLAAEFTFHGDAGTYALMTGTMGVGAVIGGLLGAGRASTGSDVIIATAIRFGIAFAAVALAPTLPVAIVALLFTGGTSVVFLSRANATMQLTADPAMRGRVMALWTMAFLGSTPVGGPVIGFIGEHAGPRWGIATGAAAAVGAALWARHALRDHAPLPIWGEGPAGATHGTSAPTMTARS